MNKTLISIGILAVFFTVCDVQAAVVIAVDRDDDDPGPVVTQSGFTSMPSDTVSVGGVTVTLSDGAGFSGERDRGETGAISGHPLADLLRDLTQSTGTDNVHMTVEVTGLAASTPYLVTLWGFDATDNDGRGTAWYEGTSNSDPLIVGFANDNDAVVQPVFSQTFMTDGSGKLSFYGEGDTNYQDPALGNNTATVVLFNGLKVETVSNAIPEPTALAVWSLLGAMGITVGSRRRRRPKQ